MNKELIINSGNKDVNLALLEDNLLVELHKETSDKRYVVGDVYLGKIKKLLPGLNAAFVDIGYKKDAFLHYLDLGPQILSLISITSQTQNKKRIPSYSKFNLKKEIRKDGKITDILKPGMKLPVQIVKEPISTKGPRVTTELSLAGRFLVLVPFSDKISISQRIKSQQEKARLKRLLMSIKPVNFGVIIRTAAENVKVAELDRDLKDLLKKWKLLLQKLKTASISDKILSELNLTSSILRDILSASFKNIHVDNAEMYHEVKDYISSIEPQKANIVKLYRGGKDIFEQFDINKQIKSSFGKYVTIKGGIYLIIEHTEAMHSIDVNSGHKSAKNSSQEENALRVNLEAAAEIARQLRLRDIGGIIVVDFIDMQKADNRKMLYRKLKEEMAKDRAKHTILPPSKFGLIQITRQRTRPETNIEVVEKCPVCKGTGEIKPSVLIVEEIEQNLSYLSREQNEEKITVVVHPFLYAYLTSGLFSLRYKWRKKFKKLKVIQNKDYSLLEYHFFNRENNEIKM